MKPSALSIDSLKVFPFFGTKEELESLKSELPAYLAKTADVNPSIDSLQWWKHNASALPYLAAASRKMLLVQPPLLHQSFPCSTPHFKDSKGVVYKTIWRPPLCCSITIVNVETVLFVFLSILFLVNH